MLLPPLLSLPKTVPSVTFDQALDRTFNRTLVRVIFLHAGPKTRKDSNIETSCEQDIWIVRVTLERQNAAGMAGDPMKFAGCALRHRPHMLDIIHSHFTAAASSAYLLTCHSEITSHDTSALLKVMSKDLILDSIVKRENTLGTRRC